MWFWGLRLSAFGSGQLFVSGDKYISEMGQTKMLNNRCFKIKIIMLVIYLSEGGYEYEVVTCVIFICSKFYFFRPEL